MTPTDWRSLSDDPPGEEEVGKTILLICKPTNGTEPQYSNTTIGWMYTPGNWTHLRAPNGWGDLPTFWMEVVGP